MNIGSRFTGPLKPGTGPIKPVNVNIDLTKANTTAADIPITGAKPKPPR